ncbi:hypothetical protein V9T40_004916 [Parthenolecanium corni]|uniref:Uncharacterized protein n=1 Tax=Parthenolecanium corni TaxID=536013 RepID=A0AAN9Y3Q9_9HEMI
MGWDGMEWNGKGCVEVWDSEGFLNSVHTWKLVIFSGTGQFTAGELAAGQFAADYSPRTTRRPANSPPRQFAAK